MKTVALIHCSSNLIEGPFRSNVSSITQVNVTTHRTLDTGHRTETVWTEIVM